MRSSTHSTQSSFLNKITLRPKRCLLFSPDMLRYATAFSLLLLLPFAASSQGVGALPLGSWREHLPFNRGISIAQSSEKVFCATEHGLIVLRKDDSSIEVLSRSAGLSGTNLSCVGYHEGTSTLLVGYDDGNVDFIKNNKVTNFGDIKRSTAVQGSKKINKITLIGDFAYLSCSFGIVVIDLIKIEVKSTLSPALSNPEIFDVAVDGDSLYAATSKGIYKASLSNPFLPYYVAWDTLPGIGYNGTFRAVAVFDNALFAIRFVEGAYESDTIFRHQNNVTTIERTGDGFRSIRNSGNRLLISGNLAIFMRESGAEGFDVLYTAVPHPADVITDNNSNNIIWSADRESGILRLKDIYEEQRYTPEGPPTTNVWKMKHAGSQLWVATGAWNDAFAPLYMIEGVFKLKGIEWDDSRLPYEGDWVRDAVGIAVDPSDADHIFVSSWVKGIAEVQDTALIKVYNDSNSTLQSLSSSVRDIRISGAAFDNDGNLWCANASVTTPMSVKRPDNTWKSFSFSSAANGKMTGDIMVDNTNNKWIIVAETGLLVVGTAEEEITGYKFLTDAAGNGALAANSVLSVAQDLEGQVWVGTTKGISVFYSPESILQEGSNDWDSQKIVISQDGFDQYLLEAEEVTAIQVDGANRKWLGTRKAGLFLVSDDGTEQLQHFTTENSPLLSNTISCLTINEKSGELFIGTDVGICSYRGDASAGGDVFGNVYAFPNPVLPDYQGPIAVSGLVADADVKITDIQGNLIYSGKANGGTLTWNGKRYSGERAATGVYLVFCSNGDGSQTKVTKIMFIN